jgi:hypothetical protein
MYTYQHLLPSFLHGTIAVFYLKGQKSMRKAIFKHFVGPNLDRVSIL